MLVCVSDSVLEVEGFTITVDPCVSLTASTYSLLGVLLGLVTMSGLIVLSFIGSP